MLEEIIGFIKDNPLIVLLILGFSSLPIFYVWGILTISGNPEEAETVKNLPDTLEKVKENVTEETSNTLFQKAVEINEDRKEAIAKEEDPNMKNLINWIYVLIYRIYNRGRI